MEIIKRISLFTRLIIAITISLFAIRIGVSKARMVCPDVEGSINLSEKSITEYPINIDKKIEGYTVLNTISPSSNTEEEDLEEESNGSSSTESAEEEVNSEPCTLIRHCEEGVPMESGRLTKQSPFIIGKYIDGDVKGAPSPVLRTPSPQWGEGGERGLSWISCKVQDENLNSKEAIVGFSCLPPQGILPEEVFNSNPQVPVEKIVPELVSNGVSPQEAVEEVYKNLLDNAGINVEKIETASNSSASTVLNEVGTSTTVGEDGDKKIKSDYVKFEFLVEVPEIIYCWPNGFSGKAQKIDVPQKGIFYIEDFNFLKGDIKDVYIKTFSTIGFHSLERIGEIKGLGYNFYILKTDKDKISWNIYNNDIDYYHNTVLKLLSQGQLQLFNKVQLNFVVYNLNAEEITPDDPYFCSQGYLKEIGLPLAWGINTGSKDVTIGVLDTGIDYYNNDLMDNVYPGLGYDFFNNDTEPKDDNGHGTQVSSIIGAVGNNGNGITGIMWNTNILPIKILGTNEELPGGKNIGNCAELINALLYAIDNKVDIINMSFGQWVSEDVNPQNYACLLQDAINKAWENNILIITSSGNDNKDANSHYPSALEHVICVTASDFYKANKGTVVDIAAPGKDIPAYGLGGKLKSISGTSASAAIVSGVAGLIKSTDPELSNEDIGLILLSSANYKGEGYGWGMVDAGKALNSVNEFSMDNLSPNVVIYKKRFGELVGKYNNMMEPGEYISMTLQLRNKSRALTNVKGTLVCRHPAIEITKRECSFSDIPFQCNSSSVIVHLIYSDSFVFYINPKFVKPKRKNIIPMKLILTTNEYDEPIEIEFNIEVDAPGILTVDQDSSEDGVYYKIQDALDAAKEGDTIIVKKGVYNEKLQINKPVSLIGVDMPILTNPEINPSEEVVCIHPDTKGKTGSILFSGFHLIGCNHKGIGIRVAEDSAEGSWDNWISISKNIIEDFDIGIMAQEIKSAFSVNYNKIQDVTNGIYLAHVPLFIDNSYSSLLIQRNYVFHNLITGYGEGTGVSLLDCVGYLTNNIIDNFSKGVYVKTIEPVDSQFLPLYNRIYVYYGNISNCTYGFYSESIENNNLQIFCCNIFVNGEAFYNTVNEVNNTEFNPYFSEDYILGADCPEELKDDLWKYFYYFWYWLA